MPNDFYKFYEYNFNFYIEVSDIDKGIYST